MQEGEIAIDLKPVGNGPSTTFTDAEVVTALILFCSKKNIPIPRKPATKSLGIANDGVSLQIEIGSRTTVLK